MKPNEKKPEIVYRIIDRGTKSAVGSYSRACCDEYDFTSVEDARGANCHDMFQDKHKYAIAKYKVTYELIEPDIDPAIGEPPPPKSREETIAGILEKFYPVGWTISNPVREGKE